MSYGVFGPQKVKNDPKLEFCLRSIRAHFFTRIVILYVKRINYKQLKVNSGD